MEEGYQLAKLKCGINFAPALGLPPVALLSCPGSGNTWLRHLIELMTGIYTGSVYQDKVLYQGGFLGEFDEWNSGRVVAVKTHTRSKIHLQRFSSVILLIRNPYGAIASEVNRRLGGHTFQMQWTKELAESEEFSTTVVQVMNYWERIIHNVFENYMGPVLVIHYEDIKQQPEEMLKRIVNFLNMNVDQERLFCIKQELSGNFKRELTVADRKVQFEFVKGQNQNITERIMMVNKLLLDRGYPQVVPYDL
ncbi:sialate:O-sulfotransferase 2-like [Ptychodera flava]|uniref:sialate:O-sulfotransferase 2-like n=1 Tax=Ptychodera flava TaxID=63121 RepID=UPI003969D448